MSDSALHRAKSYERINYILRPKKQIERKIIIELLRSVVGIQNYSYIGLGSIYYYDFILFHKYLNITKMVSLDYEDTLKRFKFNIPYDFIEFQNSKTTDYLKELTFNPRIIIWFDYDSSLFNSAGQVNQAILEDVEIIARQATSPTFFMLTVNVGPPKKRDLQDGFRNEFGKWLSDEFKTEKYLINNAFFFEDFPKMVQNVLLNVIFETSKLRETTFYKLFSFSYADGAHMYTLGGLFATKSDMEDIDKNIRQFEFLNGEPRSIFDIDVPILTYKEKIYIDAKIQSLRTRISATRGKKEMKKILNSLDFELESSEMLNKYLQYGKYYPQYFEGII